MSVPDLTATAARRLAGFGNRRDRKLAGLADSEIRQLSQCIRRLVLTMRDRLVACCPCFETLASLAPQHEAVLFQQVRPHPRVTASPLSLEEAANGSRECAPDDRLRAVSKDGLQYRFVIPGTSDRR